MTLPLLFLPGCATTGSRGGVTEGLRRLLEISSRRALTRLVIANGYLDDPEARIVLPADRSTAVLGALLRSAPVRRERMLVVNRAATDAADRAAPLAYDSIRSLTFADALGIAHGCPTAATSYLERSIGYHIIDTMRPEVGDVLRQFGGNSILGPVLARPPGSTSSASSASSPPRRRRACGARSAGKRRRYEPRPHARATRWSRRS